METDINVNRTGFVDFLILLRSNYFFYLISPLKTKYHITDTKQIYFLVFFFKWKKYVTVTLFANYLKVV